MSDKNFRTLVFKLTLAVVVSLSAFNVYLFCWLWTGLGGVGLGASEWSRMNLVSSWDVVKFKDKLSNKLPLEIYQTRSGESQAIKIIARKKLQVLDNHNTTLLQLEPDKRRVWFPSGLRVTSSSNETSLDCDALALCRLRAPKIKLSNRQGVDLKRKSVQVARLELDRIHSPTMTLNLVSTNASSFVSRKNWLIMSALDELVLLSRKSFVILDAKSIDVSQVGKLADRASRSPDKRSGAYKLCICLKNKRSQWRHKQWKGLEGLVFGVRARLSCSQFSSFCGGFNGRMDASNAN